MPSKFCVFCGQSPDKKTKEHVVPQWLIKLTGDPSRESFFGYDWTSPELTRRYYSWKQFTFPACKACNESWSDREGQVNQAVCRMLEGDSVAAHEIVELLTWIDKVRIGVWLGFLYLNKNHLELNPTFYINDRVAVKDRVLLIFESLPDKNGIGLTGVDTPIFQQMPSAFILSINHLHFASISNDCLVSKQLGWPYHESRRFNAENFPEILVQLAKGSKKIEFGILPEVPLVDHKILSQPIFLRSAYQEDTEYIAANSFADRPGLSLIHI